MSTSQKTGHELAENMVYGPVQSRRYGVTLGINLLPANQKVCNFSCVYCQLGMNNKRIWDVKFPDRPTLKQDFETFIQNHAATIHWDHLVISGNGEPTLHPDFHGAIEELLSLKKIHLPQVKTVCFTNGSKLFDPKIRQALSLMDECALKLDPAMESVNLPDDVNVAEILQHASQLPNLVIQSCLFMGKISNITRDDLNTWTRHLIRLKPKRIDLYTVSRQTAVSGIEALREKQLKDIAARLIRDHDLPVRVS